MPRSRRTTNSLTHSLAALYDVHGNVHALDAVLEDVERAGADLIVFGGDIASGAFPRETLDRVRGLGAHARAIRGNADRELLADDPRELSAWAAGQLRDEDRAFLRTLPPTLTVSIEGLGPTLFCHATPESDEPVFTIRTPDERVEPLFAGVRERTVVCGHTHMQFERRVGDVRVVNAGSVGMSYGTTDACWALLGPDVELRRTPYDREAAAAAIRATDWPMADEIARENVLHSPSAEEALDFFDGLAV